MRLSERYSHRRDQRAKARSLSGPRGLGLNAVLRSISSLFRPHTLVAILSLATMQWATADAPKVTHLFPAGTQRGATTTVSCNGTFDWPLKVWSSAGETKIETEKGKLTISVPDNLATDRIWLRFYNDEGATSPIPFLLGNLPETDEVEPNDSPTSAQRLSEFAKPPNDARVTINGKLQKKGDVDAFAVELKTGQTLVAAVAGNTHFGSPLDAIVQIVSPTGVVLAENHDDVGLDPRLAFTCQEAGKYLVRVFAFPATPNQSINFHGGDNYVYRLTLTTGPYLLHCNPSVISSNEFGLRTPGVVSLLGWNLDPQIKAPVRRLLGGEVESYGIGITAKSRLGLALIPGWESACRVRFVPHSVSPQGFATTTQEFPQALVVPSSTDNWISTPGAATYYKLRLRQGQQVKFDIEAQGIDSHLVPNVKLTNPKNEPVYTSRESGAATDVTFTHKAKLDGEYLLRIRDRYDHGSERHYFRLTVQEPKSDFELSLASDSVVVKPGSQTELPVTIKRNVVTEPIGEIRIAANDCPPGIECLPVVSKADGDSAKKVTLLIKSTRKQSYSGPIRITGREPGGLPRFARTPEKYRASSELIWLTALKPDGT